MICWNSKHINGTVKTGKGIDVLSILHSQRLQVFHQRTFRKMSRTAKSYVFQKMGTSFLLFGLLYRAHLHHQTKFDPGGRRRIPQNQITQSIGQATFQRSCRKRNEACLCINNKGRHGDYENSRH